MTLRWDATLSRVVSAITLDSPCTASAASPWPRPDRTRRSRSNGEQQRYRDQHVAADAAGRQSEHQPKPDTTDRPHDPLSGRRLILAVGVGKAGAPIEQVATLVAMTVEPQMPLKDVKNRLSEVVDQVEREHGRVVITKHGRPAAVVVSVEDLESLEETLDVLARPKLVAQIRDSLAELDREPAQVLSKDEALALRG
jgi:antitoxin YefM